MFDFISLRSTVQSLNERYIALCQQIEEAEKGASNLRHARICKADAKAVLSQWVERRAGEAMPRAGESLNSRFSGSFSSLSAAAASADGFSIVKHASGAIDPDAVEALFCAFHGKAVERTLHKVIDEMEWPDEGLPLAQRDAEIARLNGLASQLREERKGLERDATEAGIQLG